jgi:hypothetical protein
VLVLITLAAGTFVLRHKPDQEHFQRPFVQSGAPGAAVSARTFDVTVLAADGGAKLQGSGIVLETAGLWVIVRARVVAIDEPAMLALAQLRDERDRLFTATERVRQPLAAGRTFQPGIAVEGVIVFEVAKDVRELTLLLSSNTDLVQAVNTVAEVPLTIALDAWRKQEKPLTVPSAKVIG